MKDAFKNEDSEKQRLISQLQKGPLNQNDPESVVSAADRFALPSTVLTLIVAVAARNQDVRGAQQRLISAINPGADLAPVLPSFVSWLLSDTTHGLVGKVSLENESVAFPAFAAINSAVSSSRSFRSALKELQTQLSNDRTKAQSVSSSYASSDKSLSAVMQGAVQLMYVCEHLLLEQTVTSKSFGAAISAVSQCMDFSWSATYESRIMEFMKKPWTTRVNIEGELRRQCGLDERAFAVAAVERLNQLLASCRSPAQNILEPVQDGTEINEAEDVKLGRALEQLARASSVVKSKGDRAKLVTQALATASGFTALELNAQATQSLQLALGQLNELETGFPVDQNLVELSVTVGDAFANLHETDCTIKCLKVALVSVLRMERGSIASGTYERVIAKLKVAGAAQTTISSEQAVSGAPDGEI